MKLNLYIYRRIYYISDKVGTKGDPTNKTRLCYLSKGKKEISMMNVMVKAAVVRDDVGGRATNGHYKQYWGESSWTPEEEKEIQTERLSLYVGAIDIGCSCEESERLANISIEYFKRKLWRTRGRYCERIYKR